MENTRWLSKRNWETIAKREEKLHKLQSILLGGGGGVKKPMAQVSIEINQKVGGGNSEYCVISALCLKQNVYLWGKRVRFQVKKQEKDIERGGSGAA